jgi:hypothetical protein
MAARKYSASMDSDLLDDVERAAAEAGVTVSAFLAEAARDRVALLGLDRIVREWEAEHGVITDAELEVAIAQLEGTEPAAQAARAPRRRAARTA